MATIEVKNGNPVEAIQELLRSMLDAGLVSAVLAPQEIPSKKTVVQTLVRDSAGLDAVNPLAPVFSVNCARIITRMCIGQRAGPIEDASDSQAQGDSSPEDGDPPAEQEEPQPAENGQPDPPEGDASPPEPTDAQAQGRAPIAVVLRPCEARALVELVKLQQASLEPFLVIGIDCYGTYSVQDYAAKIEQCPEGSSVTADFLKQVTEGDLPQELRGACQVCQHPAPPWADLGIELIGEDVGRQIGLQAHTDKGRAVLEALGLAETPSSDARQEAVTKLTEARKQLAEQQDPLDFLETIASLCINCRNCRAVCPICYCKQCIFDGQVFEYPLEKYLDWSGKKGVLGMPTDKLLFHLTRMSHVATSCVACGQCEAACPNGIPLGQIYQRISRAAQNALDYEAGRSLEDELPLTTFREEELSVVEN